MINYLGVTSVQKPPVISVKQYLLRYDAIAIDKMQALLFHVVIWLRFACGSEVAFYLRSFRSFVYWSEIFKKF